jgi:3'(2'), 5'-bisphosphate nucleotidase
MNDQEISERLQTLALAAGCQIMGFYRNDCASSHKADGSPVTEADNAAEATILAGLRAAFPDIPCVAEEEMSAGKHPGAVGDTFFLIDALDGTREFIADRPEFTVNIGLIRQGRPAIGVVYAPAKRLLYTGHADSAWLTMFDPADSDFQSGQSRRLHVRARPDAVTIVASRSRTSDDLDRYVAAHPGAQRLAVGSSLKFCMVAAGEADLYPCFGRTMEWDTAAGHAVVTAAGGQVRLCTGEALMYGKVAQEDEDFANPWFIVEGVAGLAGREGAGMAPAASF